MSPNSCGHRIVAYGKERKRQVTSASVVKVNNHKKQHALQRLKGEREGARELTGREEEEDGKGGIQGKRGAF